MNTEKEIQIPYAIDVTNAKECAVPENYFTINHYTFVKNCTFDDLVTTSAPHFHFQILKPQDKKKRKECIDYFNEHNKLFVASTVWSDLLLYMGATEQIYFKSSLVKEVNENDLRNVLAMVGHWYRFYGQN